MPVGLHAQPAAARGERGRVLLQRRLDNDLWALPGGGMELTDSLPGTAVREVKEESTELRFVPPDQLEHLPIHHTQRLRLRHFLEHRHRPYLG
ncbi:MULTISPECIES: NUDIX domain-containing protein [Actinomycetes]|uniref:NUDIX domain-containing protein n=1 Tax=Actinomycetes TaxID=1760 RepID=UPI003B3AE8FE